MNIRFTHNRANPIAAELLRAAAVVQLLEQQGISVIYASCNGRRPEIYVDRFPPDVVPGMKRSTPTAGGRDVVMAAEYEKCQLQCMHFQPGRPIVLNPDLQVVR